jgi:hypothetical protein
MKGMSELTISSFDFRQKNIIRLTSHERVRGDLRLDFAVEME